MKKSDNKPKNQYDKSIIFCMLSLLIMLLIVVGSMFYFRVKLFQSSEILSQSDYRKYDSYYVMVTNNRRSAFWKNVYKSAQDEALLTNAYVDTIGDNLSSDYDTADLMQIAINSRPDGIIVQADNSVKMSKALMAAEKAGIPVVTVVEDDLQGRRKSFVGVSMFNLGREYGKQIVQIARDKKSTEENPLKVMLLLNDMQQEAGQNTVLTGILDMTASRNASDVVSMETRITDNTSAYAPEEMIRDIFIKEEQLPDVFVCLSEQNTTCVYQAVLDYNKVGEVEILGYYVSDTILDGISKNIIRATIDIDTQQMGQDCVQALDEYRQLGNVSDYYDVDTSLIDKTQLENRAKEEANEND